MYPSLKERLSKAAVSEHRSLASYIEYALARHLEEEEPKPPRVRK